MSAHASDSTVQQNAEDLLRKGLEKELVREFGSLESEITSRRISYGGDFYIQIDAYYEGHQRRYQRIGKTKAETSIRRTLQRQKANQMRKDLVAGLRAKAKVEIFE